MIVKGGKKYIAVKGGKRLRIIQPSKLIFNTFIQGDETIFSKQDFLDKTIGASVSNFIINTNRRFYLQNNSDYELEQIKDWTNIKTFLDIGGKLTEINQGVWYNEDELENIYLPNLLRVVSEGGFDTFGDNDKLEKLHLKSYLGDVNANSFMRNMLSLKTLHLPNATSLLKQTQNRRSIYDLPAIEKIIIPNVTTISNWVDDVNLILGDIKSGCVIVCNPLLQNWDGMGNRHPNIANAEDNEGAIIRYKTNSTKPSSITDLAVSNVTANTADVTFTPPASTNPIWFYEVWLIDEDDLVSKYLPNNQEITASGQTLTGLKSGTTYKLKLATIDEFYNGSGTTDDASFSNEITFTTL